MSDPNSELSTSPALRVLMVCTGNICRSPMAESILRTVHQDSAMAGLVTVDSAGTHSYHVGSPADHRAQAVLLESGYGAEHTARVVRPEWLLQRDLVLAMDEGHLRHLQRLAARANAPADHVLLLRAFDPQGPGDVPDPYYDSLAEFREVRAMIERCMPGLIDHLASRLGSGDRVD